MGFYGKSGSVEFTNCDIGTIDNKNGWSYAMYGGSVLKLVNSTMTATGMSTSGGNINAFYSGDNRTGYDAIFSKNSIIDFHDNQAGGFAINNVNIYVTDSTINVSDNLGNACNSGYWIVKDSDFTMNGNRGGHAMSCIGFEMTGSNVEILHNGYAGVYIQSKDSSFKDCSVDIRCNGEKLLSYSAGDLWLQTHKLTVDSCTSDACEGSAWLGGVGRKGAVTTTEGSSVVAYDLNTNAVDNLKSNTEPVLTNATLALNGEDNEHTLLLNPFMQSDYARGNAEKKSSNNDADLFNTDRPEDGENIKNDETDILNGEHAKIGELTDAQLSHHRYDWDAGTVKYQAAETTYGALAYPCTDVCAAYIDHTTDHAHSFNCAGTYVYAPLVGVHFDANAGEDNEKVSNMPADKTEITYGGTVNPDTVPVRASDSSDKVWVFTGWYTDAGCTSKFDPETAELVANWTVLYAGWEQTDSPSSIIGTVFHDADQDNVFDATERVYSGVTVELWMQAGDNWTRRGTTVTDENGAYSFTNLGVGTYQVRIAERPSDANRTSSYSEDLNGNKLDGTVDGAYATRAIILTAGTTERANAGFYYRSSGGGGGGSTPSTPIEDEDVPLAPGLNRDDHYAHIVGYPEDYVTGEPTDDMSRWPVKPQDNISREEVATIFFRLLDDTSRAEAWTTSNSFPDVASDRWSNNAISTAENAGIISGYTDGTFRPGNNITRAEFATIAAQFDDLDYDGEDMFSDISGHWANPYINRAAKKGWIHGYPDGTFRPDQYITRAEAMTLINAVLERVPDPDHMLDDMNKWPDNMNTSAWYYAQVQEATNSHDYEDRTDPTESEVWTEIIPTRDWKALEDPSNYEYLESDAGDVM